MAQTKKVKQQSRQQAKQVRPVAQKHMFARLSASALGLSLGIIGALLTALVVIYANTTGEISDTSLSMLGSVEGAIFAIINSFIEFALLGVAVAWLYNRFAK